MPELTDVRRSVFIDDKLCRLAVDESGNLWYLDPDDDTWKLVPQE